MAGVVTNSDASQNFDAEQAKEAISAGDEKAPKVDVAADYEASKQFSVSDIDRTEAGKQAAEAATAPEHPLSEPEAPKVEAATTGDPQEYREMAKDVSTAPQGGAEVTDDLVQKAIEMGQPQQ